MFLSVILIQLLAGRIGMTSIVVVSLLCRVSFGLRCSITGILLVISGLALLLTVRLLRVIPRSVHLRFLRRMCYM